MRKIVFLCLVMVAVVFSAGIAGCGSRSGGTGGSRAAKTFEDGADKYDPMQMRCPVCDSQPLNADYYADVDGKRIYFDKQECMEKFKQNTEQYLKKFKTYKQRMKEMYQRKKRMR